MEPHSDGVAWAVHGSLPQLAVTLFVSLFVCRVRPWRAGHRDGPGQASASCAPLRRSRHTGTWCDDRIPESNVCIEPIASSQIGPGEGGGGVWPYASGHWGGGGGGWFCVHKTSGCVYTMASSCVAVLTEGPWMELGARVGTSAALTLR